MCEVIRPLLFSSLPIDVVVNEIFAKHVYRYQSPLSEEQKDSIINNHFLFKKILTKYYNDFEREQTMVMNYLDMLDNDLCFAINDGYPLHVYKSQYLEDHPEIFKAITVQVQDCDVAKSIYDMWCMMSNEKKTEVYEYLMNRWHEARAIFLV